MRVLSNEEFVSRGDSCQYFYNSSAFHDINKQKVDKVFTFAFGDNKIRAFFTAGKKENRLIAPYSSPFSMIEFKKSCTIEDIDNYVKELDLYMLQNELDEIEVTLPPMFYDETNITKVLSAFLRDGYSIVENQINYQIFINSEEEYLNSLQRNAKKNLNHALTVNYVLSHCESNEEKELAYEIIKKNRESKGYRLSMSLQQVMDTIRHVEHDFFVLYKDEIPVASAIIFRVTEDVYQVVYWGDIPGYSEDRPINFLAYKLFQYYLSKNIRVLDIGPSMLDGEPNYGLCDFKESIGCDASSKFIVSKKFSK